jgi:putative ABC transport system ATP-binding protein
MNSIVELIDVRKTYRRGSEIITAVDGVTLSVAPGDFVAIVGPSGSGKTTLLNLIGCVDKPESGIVRIADFEVNRVREQDLTKIRAEKIGFVFQQFFLLPTLTVEENVQLPAMFVRNGDRSRRAAELLELVHLSGRAEHRPSQLSGGEMQRVAIARALVNQPEILLADEPTGNLDSQNAQAIIDLFRELNSGGLTVLMVTHNRELARQARRAMRLKDGKMGPRLPEDRERQPPASNETTGA